MDNPTLFNVFSLVLAAMSLAAIVLSVFTYIQSTKTALKVSSKEYEMTENLKYEILKMIADLKAIDAKAATPCYKGKLDFTQEIASLTKIQSSPGYLLLLHSIKDDDKRLLLEETFRFFTMSSLKKEWIREWVHIIIEILRTNADFTDSINMNLNDLVKELCEMKTLYTTYDESEAKRKNELTRENFIKANQTLIVKGGGDDVKNYKIRVFQDTKAVNDERDFPKIQPQEKKSSKKKQSKHR